MYSDIISAEDYCNIMDVHVYMKEADDLVVQSALRYDAWPDDLFVDIGCGPGRITHKLAGRVSKLMGLDVDPKFLAHARVILKNDDVSLLEEDLLSYKPNFQADVVVSHGLDHHIAPEYLNTVSAMLKPGGVYVLGDEFLPPYQDEEERRLRAVIWYSHVIDTAYKEGHNKLAVEEAHTLLDDLGVVKTMVRTHATTALSTLINSQAKDFRRAEHLAKDFLGMLSAQTETVCSIPSRGDHKVCHREFAEKVERFGFRIESLQTVGPMNTLGGFGIYVLRKN